MSNDSSAAETSLADRLLADSGAIVARSLEYMPRDAFWELRYAERARRFANEDGAFHVKYLSDALRARSQTIMIEYARWLRDLLVPRGMCTLHLAEHLDHVGKAVGDEMNAGPAIAYMAAAVAALRYTDEPAAGVQGAADALERSIDDLERPRAGDTRNSAWQTRYLVHYIADAINRNQPELLSAHVKWSRQLFVTQGGDAARFDRWLSAIDAALSKSQLPAEFRACRSDS
jgi:hypothetical protein